MTDSIPEIGKDQKETIAAKEKSKNFGVLSLTAKDHLAIGSTPPDELTNEPDKALYETMTDDKIEEYLNLLLDFVYDPKLIKNGFAKIQKDEFLASIHFLKSVNRLPKIFDGFSIEELPDFETIIE